MHSDGRAFPSDHFLCFCLEACGTIISTPSMAVCLSVVLTLCHLPVDTFTLGMEVLPILENLPLFLCHFYSLYFPGLSSWDPNFAGSSAPSTLSAPFSPFFPTPLVSLALFL